LAPVLIQIERNLKNRGKRSGLPNNASGLTPCSNFSSKASRSPRADFADRLMQRIRALDGTLLVHHDAASFVLRIGGNAPGTLYLDSLYKDYLHASQEDREAVLLRQATVSVAPAAPAAVGRLRDEHPPVSEADHSQPGLRGLLAK
jgi:hypothetical protein